MLAGMILSLLLAGGPETSSRVLRLPPTDECAADRSFVEFRRGLLAAIERRDRDAVLAVVTDDIQTDFGGGAGRDEFARAWQLDRAADSPLWSELGDALRLGCGRHPGTEELYAPSMFVAEEAFADPFTAAVAVKSGTELRSAPDGGGELIGTLDWDVLTVPEWDQDAAWQRVETADGRSGYVRTADIRSPIDYRAAFEQIDGRWRMVAFIAGD